MAIIKDPEGKETSALHAMVDFKDQRVLEVGCGDGRLTWRYAENADNITAIDPAAEEIEAARVNTPERLKERVQFLQSTIDDFAASFKGEKFDTAIFAWSL